MKAWAVVALRSPTIHEQISFEFASFPPMSRHFRDRTYPDLGWTGTLSLAPMYDQIFVALIRLAKILKDFMPIDTAGRAGVNEQTRYCVLTYAEHPPD